MDSLQIDEILPLHQAASEGDGTFDITTRGQNIYKITVKKWNFQKILKNIRRGTEILCTLEHGGYIQRLRSSSKL